MHADRTNRVLLLVLGLLLLIAGAAGLLLGSWSFGTHRVDERLLDNGVSRFIGEQGSWFWPVAAAVAIVVAVLCLRWMVVILFSTPRLANIRIPAGAGAGRTRLAASALGGALSGEIETYRGVHAARTSVQGEPSVPRLAISVSTNEDADLAALTERIITQAVAHARQALEIPALPVRLDITMTRRAGQRVV